MTTPDPTAEPLTGDHLHVLLDALHTHRTLINHREPWGDYDGADPAEDPKASAEGYWRLINEVHDALENALGKSEPLTFDAAATSPARPVTDPLPSKPLTTGTI